MLSALLGGFGPGLVSTILCTVALDYFWTEPPYRLFHPNLELLLFFLISVAASKLIGSLRSARARADAAKSSREQVLAVVAHDLRNPLTTVRMTSAALQSKPTDHATLRQRLESIDRAVVRMEMLIRDLVDATRMEHGEFTVSVREEQASTIVQEAADSFVPVARDKTIVLEVGASRAGIALTCDRDRVLQALGNLLGNAIKFTPEGGRVELRIENDGEYVRFVVQDTGPGIKPEHLPHIFERYWNSDRKGTGLGLFIARSIAREHGGDIEVQSAPGLGATFVLCLPEQVRKKVTQSTRGWIGKWLGTHLRARRSAHKAGVT